MEEKTKFLKAHLELENLSKLNEKLVIENKNAHNDNTQLEIFYLTSGIRSEYDPTVLHNLQPGLDKPVQTTPVIKDKKISKHKETTKHTEEKYKALQNHQLPAHKIRQLDNNPKKNY